MYFSVYDHLMRYMQEEWTDFGVVHPVAIIATLLITEDSLYIICYM